MAASEDEVAKKQIQEAVWVWTGRILVLLVTFGFGFFAAWVMWGAGNDGAPALRTARTMYEGQVRDLKNKQVDIEGRLTVCQGRLDQCQGALAKAQQQ